MSDVDYKKWLCHPVDFKKTSCRPADFKKASCRHVDFKKVPCRMLLSPKKGCVTLSILEVYTQSAFPGGPHMGPTWAGLDVSLGSTWATHRPAQDGPRMFLKTNWIKYHIFLSI